MTGHRHVPGGHTGTAAGPRNSRYLAGALVLILAFMADQGGTNRPEPMEESNLPAALASDHRRVRTVRPHRRAVAEPGLAGTDDQQAAHVNAARIQRFQTGDGQLLTVAADVAADDDRSLRRTEFEEQFVGSEDLLPPGTRGRVVDGEDQVGFRDCAQPLLDH